MIQVYDPSCEVCDTIVGQIVYQVSQNLRHLLNWQTQSEPIAGSPYMDL